MCVFFLSRYLLLFLVCGSKTAEISSAFFFFFFTLSLADFCISFAPLELIYRCLLLDMYSFVTSSIQYFSLGPPLFLARALGTLRRIMFYHGAMTRRQMSTPDADVKAIYRSIKIQKKRRWFKIFNFLLRSVENLK